MKNTKYLIYIYLVTSLVIFAGCWDSKELDQLAIILGTGVDKDGKNLQLTAQIVKPEQIKGGGNGGQSSGGGNEAVFVSQSSGITVFEAVRNAQNQSSRKMFFPHNQVIVIGRDLAKQGIYPALDFFFRYPEPRPTEWVLIADDQAADIFKTKPELEKTSASILNNLIKDGAESKVCAINLQEINASILNTSGSYLIPIVRVMGKGAQSRIILDGTAAVFKRDKMVGDINSSESRGVKWVKGEVRDTSVVSRLSDNKGIVSTRIILNISSVKVSLVDGSPRVKVYVNVEGEIADQNGILNLSTSQGMKQVNESTEHTIKREILSAIRKAQSLNADVFDFGRVFSQTYPKQWKKMESSWQESFQNLNIEVKVGANLWRVGEISQTTIQ